MKRTLKSAFFWLIMALIPAAYIALGLFAWATVVPDSTKQSVAEAYEAFVGRQAEAEKPKEVFVAKPPSITVFTVASEDIFDVAEVSGTLVAREEINVTPEVDGLMIEEVLVQEGDRVTAGQVLARLSRTTLEIERSRLNAQIARWDAAMAQSKATIAEANAAKIEAEKALSRAKQLRRSNTVSEAVLDQRESSADAADARVNSADQALEVAIADKAAIEAQLKDLDIRLARTEIKAPKAGVVTRKTARVGAVAGMAGGSLFTLLAGGEAEFEAEVPEGTLPKLSPGLTVRVVPTGFEAPIAGKLRMIMPEIDTATRLGKVRITLAANESLRLGTFARGTIEIDQRKGLQVPVSALSFDGDGNFVQVVNGGVVRSQAVKVGLITRGRAEILSGLAVGDEIVERAGSFLRNGDKVVPVKADQSAAMKLSASQ